MQEKRLVIVKVSNDRFVKYKSDNIMSLVKFLDKEFKGWRYMNVYDKVTRSQIGSFTKNKRPTKHI